MEYGDHSLTIPKFQRSFSNSTLCRSSIAPPARPALAFVVSTNERLSHSMISNRFEEKNISTFVDATKNTGLH